MNIDIDKFYSAYREVFGKIRHSQVEGLDTILGLINNDSDKYSTRHLAYLLATIKHECANTWKPIEERGNLTYFNKYEYNTNLGRDLGNTERGDGYLYRGRGYSQLTGRFNYFRFSRELNLTGTNDLIAYPNKALEPETAYKILTVGCSKGLFTGVCLPKYINEMSCDYRNARRVINGLDKADVIQEYCHFFENILYKSSIA